MKMAVSRTSVNRIALSDQDRTVLQDLAQARLAPSREARRACIILLSADGHSVEQICRMVGCASDTVKAWRSRFLKMGIAGLCPASPRPKPSRITR
jgi:DNA-directed RNA polymerase specialized sigma24 family protein